jgi:hypothetical protein
MNLFYCGASLLFAGTIPLILFCHQGPDTKMELLIGSIRPLSLAGKESFSTANSGDDPSENPIKLSANDLITTFWNSRLFIQLANRARLCDPQNGDLASALEVMQEKHAKLRWLLLLSVIESIVGRLGLGMYARILLWTYGEELELLSLISKKCGPEGHAIQAIL